VEQCCLLGGAVDGGDAGDAAAFTSFGSSGAALHRVEVSAAAGVTGAELQALCAG